jgi:hypothetical protein
MILMSSTDLTDLAWDLASDGFVGHEAAVRQVVRTAYAQGVSAGLTGVLADVRQPEVARLRAFGRVAAELATPAGVGRPVAASHAA